MTRNMQKSTQEILAKLKIQELNPMQEEAFKVIPVNNEVVLLSPTGTGKTLAFLLPIIESIDETLEEVQVLIIVPSRELAIQTEQVIRNMATGLKTNAVYGGRPFSKDKLELEHRPSILVGTPGRLYDHLQRNTFPKQFLKTLVLDEFDKSLEIGFEEEMKEIIYQLPRVQKKVLTSATQAVEIPTFVKVKEPILIDFLGEKKSKLTIKKVISLTKDKLETLLDTLCHVGNDNGIIFCNFKDTIQYVSDFLTENNISHGCFYGKMEQKDRERALIKFRNGTHKILLATDLAARGIDIPELKFIIHYQLPFKESEFTHRNGRTARMNSEGTAYVIQWENEKEVDFLEGVEETTLTLAEKPKSTDWTTLFISGGRKDKISKGDIAGLFFKQGKLEKDELGIIELKSDCAFVAIKSNKANKMIKQFNNTRLKKKKVRITEI